MSKIASSERVRDRMRADSIHASSTGPKAFKRATRIKVEGATAPSNDPYIKVMACGRSAWLRLADLTTPQGRERLIRNHIILIGDDWKQLMAAVDAVKPYPVRPLLEAPGWSGPRFALPDGQAFGVSNGEKPIVLFERIPNKCMAAGTLKAWLTGLERLLAEQSLPTFCLMVAFAGPLLALTNRVGNFGFELAGPKGVGKSTLQQLAASTTGAGVNPSGSNYWISANATANGLETAMIAHSDLTMIIEEMNLYAAGDNGRVRANKFDELIFRLANGSEKWRHGKGQPVQSRLVYLTSTNEPVMQLLAGHRAAVSEAAADRLLTIPIDSSRKNGAFDSVPDGMANSGALAKALAEVISANHGVAMPRFLERLTRARAKNEEEIRARVAGLVERFRERVNVDHNNGSATRVADAFGLVYAAGRLAQRYGALPRSLDCLRAAVACYDLNRAASAEGLPALDRLLQIAASQQAKHVELQNLPAMSTKELEACPAIVRHGQGGTRELILTQAALRRLFPVPGLALRSPAVKAIWVRDGSRRTVKRQIRSNKRADRVLCFRLPGESE